MVCLGRSRRTLENLADLLESQKTADRAGLAVRGEATEPAAQNDGEDGVLDLTVPLLVVPGEFSGCRSERDVDTCL